MQTPPQFFRLSQTHQKTVIFLGVVLLYIALFYPLITVNGSAGILLAVVPVAMAGWFFGSAAGFIAGLAAIGLNAGLLWLFNGTPEMLDWLLTNWSGSLMMLVMGYASGVLEKQYYERARIRMALHLHEQFVTHLNLTIRDVLIPLSDKNYYLQLANHLANLFSADYVYVLHWSASQGVMALLATTRPNSKHATNFVLERDKATPNSVFIGQGQALVLNDAASPSLVHLPSLKEFSMPANSEFVLPLIAGEHKFGAVVFGFDTPRRVAIDEIILSQLTSSQVALALWTTEQDARIKKQLQEASTLSKIERALSETEKVGLETLLQLIVDSARELIPASQKVVLHLVDDENQILIPRAVAGVYNSSRKNMNMRLGEGVAGQVIASGTSICVSDVNADPRFKRQADPVDYCSLVVVPIKKNEQTVLGTISMESEEVNAFTPDDEALLNTLGVQAAIAIENTSLLETTRQDLQELKVLYHISRSLANTLDPNELFEETTRLIWQMFGFYHTQIYTTNFERQTLQVRAASGEQAAVLMSQQYELKIGDGIVGHVAELGQTFMTNNVEAVVFYLRNPLLPETQSELTVPILVDGKVAGILDIQEKPPRQFSQRHMNLMMAVADHLAVALQKANLYQELQASLRQEKEMRAQFIQTERLTVAGRLLASISHELNNPLQAIQNALFLIKTDEMLSAQGRQDLDIILSETERMASLIGRLRSTYRDMQAEDFQETQLNALIEDVYGLTCTYMRHHGIAFTFHPDSNLPAVQVIPDKIRQVVLNLFMNAIEAMQSGGELIIHTCYLPEQEQVLITFADTGPGINPAIQSRIFEPFVTDKETGTGLGLTITADIVHQHGGEIQAENNPGAGATFKVWLPIRRDA